MFIYQTDELLVYGASKATASVHMATCRRQSCVVYILHILLNIYVLILFKDLCNYSKTSLFLSQHVYLHLHSHSIISRLEKA